MYPATAGLPSGIANTVFCLCLDAAGNAVGVRRLASLSQFYPFMLILVQLFSVAYVKNGWKLREELSNISS